MKEIVPDERMFSVPDTSAMLRIDRHTVQNIFENEPGVIIIGGDRASTQQKRRYRAFRIPESVLRRVATRLTVRKRG